MVKIAVLGAGTVGRTLAAGWVRAGHRVVLGSRDPASERVTAAVAETGAAGAAEHAEAVSACDVVVVTVPGDQVEGLIGALGGALAGRVAVDATNHLAPGTTVLHHVDALTAAGATLGVDPLNAWALRVTIAVAAAGVAIAVAGRVALSLSRRL
mgnify:CR=1 FL=1